MNPIKKVFETSDLSTYIAKYAYEPKTYIVSEGDTKTVWDYLSIGKEHDTICYMSFNCFFWSCSFLLFLISPLYYFRNKFKGDKRSKYFIHNHEYVFQFQYHATLSVLNILPTSTVLFLCK